MTRQQNMTKCECDRCGATELLASDSPDQAKWHDRERITVSGTKQTILLCESCDKDYTSFMDNVDSQFAEFLAEKRK